MEPVIATAIISGIVSGAAAAATQTTISGIGAAYTSLKNLLVRKYGEENKVTEAVERLEQEPDSEGWKLLLQEAAAKAETDKDAELVKAAEALQEEVKKVQGGNVDDVSIDQKVSGDHNKVIAIGKGDKVNITA
ncbi:MAG: hypothetical protein ACL93V_03320 [Candidatus Electrothrix sp. YB6]